MNQGMPPHMQGGMQHPPAKSKRSWGITCLVILACSVPLLGVFGAVGIYGMRRYLSSAKTSEAKNTIGSIARGQVAAYEKNGKLCGSAPPVPARAPMGTKYQSSPAEGADFQRGSDIEGWRCLRFEVTHPQYFKYEMRAGSGYRGPAVGGTDPGPDGFEAIAEGDLDGDGTTSLFILSGKVDAASKQVVLSPAIFVVDEHE